MSMHWLDVYEQNSVVNSVCVDDWIAELAIIASNGLSKVANQITLTVALALSSWVNHWSVKRKNIGVNCELLQCHQFFVLPANLVH